MCASAAAVWPSFSAGGCVHSHGRRRACREAFNRLTELADQLLAAGDLTVYSRPREALLAELAGAEPAGPGPGPGSASAGSSHVDDSGTAGAAGSGGPPEPRPAAETRGDCEAGAAASSAAGAAPPAPAAPAPPADPDEDIYADADMHARHGGSGDMDAEGAGSAGAPGGARQASDAGGGAQAPAAGGAAAAGAGAGAAAAGAGPGAAPGRGRLRVRRGLRLLLQPPARLLAVRGCRQRPVVHVHGGRAGAGCAVSVWESQQCGCTRWSHISAGRRATPTLQQARCSVHCVTIFLVGIFLVLYQLGALCMCSVRRQGYVVRADLTLLCSSHASCARVTVYDDTWRCMGALQPHTVDSHISMAWVAASWLRR
jgi:hypothetical protein